MPIRAGANAATRQIEVEGKAATVFGLTGPDGRPGLTFAPGEAFDVTLDNRLAEPTLIHWHGMTEPWRQDGVPDLSQPALAPGKSYTYGFPLNRSGTLWMHSHYGLQEQQLLAAPLILHDRASAAAEEQEVVLLLHDFSFRAPEEILASLQGSSMNTPGMNGMSGMSGMSGMNGMASGGLSAGGMAGMSGMAPA
ncbi:MAG TPA: multicopper oxidase domain-containing protein [Dongiaceae bacterium]|jgi:FtsP/CotA-like multicopper oxidase with cupredoxin domain